MSRLPAPREVCATEHSESCALHQECERGDRVSCHRLGVRLAQKPRTRRRLSLSARYFESACRLDWGPSCTALGFQLERGDLGRRELRLAVRYYKRGCELKEANGCRSLAL
ncbi:MAG: sel1 repeat family protein, partial [Myxococcales bacterium]|nr:sel1 repeat family protein [Myxococcales bacterium]